MNIQAIIVERASGRSMMSRFHGLFSVGGIAGAGGMAVLLSCGASPLMAAAGVSLGVLAALVAVSHLLSYGSKNEGPAFAIPHGIVLLIGLLWFVLFLAEGAVLDWSAVFLTSIRRMVTAYAGLGYAAFATTMTIGRLAGDRIVDWLGPKRVVLVGGLCAAAGFVVTTVVPSWQVGLLGYALVGVGRCRLLEHRPGAVQLGGSAERHAGERRGPRDHDPWLCRHPCWTGSRRLHSAIDEPSDSLPHSSRDARRRFPEQSQTLTAI
jgi:hypothetical protein